VEDYGLRGTKKGFEQDTPYIQGEGHQTYSIIMLENEKNGGRTLV